MGHESLLSRDRLPILILTAHVLSSDLFVLKAVYTPEICNC